jgi:hypothetical protein
MGVKWRPKGAIKSFILTILLLSLLDSAITWAETFAQKKIEALKSAYTWR